MQLTESGGIIYNEAHTHVVAGGRSVGRAVINGIVSIAPRSYTTAAPPQNSKCSLIGTESGIGSEISFDTLTVAAALRFLWMDYTWRDWVML